MIRALLIATSLLAAWTQAAAALSCMVPDPLEATRSAQSQEDGLVLRGALHVPREMPGYVEPRGTLDQFADTLMGKSSRSKTVTGTFTGVAMNTGATFDGDILLVPDCFGNYCGAVSSRDDVWLIAWQDASGTPKVHLSPCGGSVFDTGDPERNLEIKTCAETGSCDTPE